MQSELENAKQAADQAKAQATELAKRAASLNSELEKTNAQRNELQTKLDQATSEIESAQSHLRISGRSRTSFRPNRIRPVSNQIRQISTEPEKANAQSNMVDPGIAGWQSDLASYVKVGDFLMAQGNLVEALKWYRDGLAVADRLAKANPENAGWQHDVSISYNKIGDALMAQGNLTEALKSYRDSLAVADRLAKADRMPTARAISPHMSRLATS